MNTTQSNQKGQALVLLVLGMVVLLGFTALAVDGGMIYSDRRHAQTASDASSLAGGSVAAMILENKMVTYSNYNCSSSAISEAKSMAATAAISRAGDNDYAIDNDISDDHGVTVICGVENKGGWDDKFLDIETHITRQTDTAFSHFVFNGPMVNRVEAVTRVRPRTPLAYGNAIVALRPDCPNSNTGGVHFGGGVDATVTGGGVFSNACLTTGGSYTIDVQDEINCVGSGCYTNSGGSGTISPSPGENASPLPPGSYDLPSPESSCSLLPNRGSYNGDGIIERGRYSEIKITGGSHTMEPGLICVDNGGNPNKNGFSVNGGELTGTDITIFLGGGTLSMGGNGIINISAPPARNCGNPCSLYHAVAGVLIYVDPSNPGEIALQGGSDNFYMGMVYAPASLIDITGTSGEYSPVNAQLIGDTVKVSGDAEIIVNFDDELNHQKPATIELYK